MISFIAHVVLRLGVFGFFLVTSVYATLNCSPFAFDMFVKPLLLPWLGTFINWHHLWLVAAYAVSLMTLPWGLLRSRGPRAPREQAAYWLTVAYASIGAAVVVRVIDSPLLPTLWKSDRALPVALASLLPPLALAVIDLLTAPPAIWTGGGRTTTAWRRLLAACSGAAVYFWALHLARALWQADGGSAAAWALTGIRGFLLSAVFFAFLYSTALLLSAIAARARAPRGAEIALAAGALAAVICEFLRRQVLPSIALEPAMSAVLAAAFALTLVATWTGFAARRPLDASRPRLSGLDILLVPRLSRAALVGSLVAVPCLAFAALDAIQGLDWNFVVRRTVVGAEALALLALMLGAKAHVQDSARSSRALMVPPALVLAMFVGLTPLASRFARWSGDAALEPEIAFQRYATAEAGFQELTDILVDHAGGDVDYYAFLHAHADFSGTTSVSVPDISLLPPAARAAHASGRRPDVFMFVIDSLRRDYLSPYNPAVTFTPNTEALAADGFVFQNAFTRHGGTELAITSMWAGAQVVRKVRTQGLSRMNAIEKLVNSNGYRVAINDFTVAANLSASTPVTVIDEEVASADTDLCSNLTGLERYLDASSADSRPVFAFFAPMNVHIVNTRNNGTRASNRDYPGFYAPYAERLERLDGCLGQFTAYLKERGRYDESIIILTSDHGDSLGENGFWGHAMYLFPEVVRIPLIVHVPESLKAQLTTDLWRLAFSTDIAPTLYALLGHPVTQPAELFGEPLFVSREQSLSDRRRASFLLTSSYGPTYAMLRRNGRFLYVSDLLQRREFAYDLTRAPIGAPVAVDEGLRWLNQQRIRQQVADLAAFYGFSPRRGS